MKNKSLIIIAAVMVVFIGGAALLYNRLAPQLEHNNLKTETSSQQTGQTEENSENSSQNDEEVQLSKAPDFIVYDADGNESKLSDYIGKPVIVNFWASWCGPCKSEMPDFEEKFKQYGDEIQFMMINITDGDRETFESAKDFVENSGYTFPVFYDTQLDASNTYYVYYLPTTYFIDAQGNGIAQATSALSAETLQMGIDMIYTEK